ENNFSLTKILNKINRVVHADEFLEDIFSTLSIVLIDDEKKTLTYAGAGDLPLLRYEQRKGEIIQYKSQGLLLGFFESGNYNEQEINLEKGDEAYLVSDGMIDFELDGHKKSDIR